MNQPSFDPDRFFDSFPRFVDTSETGHWRERLNSRYTALIHANRELIEGAKVLDLASHDGRFAFAALANGADHVVGIELKEHLAGIARENLEFHDVDPGLYTLLVGDMFDCLDLHGPFDVVFCFGILYHINDHMGLLNRIAEISPGAIIIDSNISEMTGSLIEVRNPRGDSPPSPGSDLEGYPTRGALDAMFSSFGWSADYFDWAGSGMCERKNMRDYREGRRISAVVDCPEHAVDLTVRSDAVQEVFRRETGRTQFVLISMVAERYGISPQALRTWVRQARRQRSLESGFAGSCSTGGEQGL